MTVKIIAVDPGARYTGVAILTLADGVPVRLNLDEIEDVGKNQMPAKVRAFLDFNPLAAPGLDKLVLAIEKSIPPKKQAYNWELTSRVRGVVQSCVTAGVDFHELTAREVRSALGVRPLSRRSKESLKLAGVRGITQDAQVKEAMCKLCGLAPVLLKSTHKVDALALAVVVALRHYRLQLEAMKNLSLSVA